MRLPIDWRSPSFTVKVEAIYGSGSGVFKRRSPEITKEVEEGGEMLDGCLRKGLLVGVDERNNA